jgi:hypothetical protein
MQMVRCKFLSMKLRRRSIRTAAPRHQTLRAIATARGKPRRGSFVRRSTEDHGERSDVPSAVNDEGKFRTPESNRTLGFDASPSSAHRPAVAV